jgi:hypothetical protein
MMFPNQAGPRCRPVLVTTVTAALLLAAAACSSSTSSGSASGSAASPGASAASGAAAAPGGSPSGAGSASGALQACASAVAPTVSGSGPSDIATAGHDVDQNFTKFFSPSTPGGEKVMLLQNGQHLGSVLQGFSGNPLAGKATVTVTAVRFTSPTTADVTYNLCEGGSPALPNSKGKAVLENGTWKVSDTTLCALVALNNNGKPVPGCT